MNTFSSFGNKAVILDFKCSNCGNIVTTHEVTVPKPDLTDERSKDIYVSSDDHTQCSHCKDDYTIDISSNINDGYIDLMDNKGIDVSETLVDIKVIPEDYEEPEWQNKSKKTKPSRLLFKREASEKEKALNVNKYADALALFFNNIKDTDFCFGIFGSWGRGKTFLMNQISDRLKKSNSQVVEFDAWKYKQQPQTWAHLYETFINASRNTGFIKYNLHKIRFGIHKFSITPFVVSLLILIFSALPKQKLLTSICPNFPASNYKDIVEIILNGLGGLSVVIFILILYLKIRKFGLENKKHYLNLPSHRNILGLQDSIGQDLYHFILSFKRRHITLVNIISNVILILFFGHILSWRLIQIHYSFYTLLVSIIATVILPILGYILLSYKPNINDLYLVIDNLDRCHPSEMLEIIESVRLLLENSELKNELKILILIDEEKLRFAIAEKYCHQIAIDKSENNSLCLNEKHIDKKSQIVEEQLEKIFISHFRLSQITTNEKIIFFQKIYEEYTSQTKDSIVDKKIQSTLDELDNTLYKQNSILVKSDNEIGNVFNNKEKEFFSKYIETIILQGFNYNNIKGDKEWSPRAIRSIFLKYQLARFTLSRLMSDEVPFEQLCIEFASKIRSGNSNSNVPEYIQQVVSQVI